MITPQNLKQFLSPIQYSTVQPKLSRKTILLKKKYRQIMTSQPLDIPLENLYPSATPTIKFHETLDNISSQITQKREEGNMIQRFGNSVSCQTNYTLNDQQAYEIPFDDPIWLQVIPQELLTTQSPQEVLQSNKDYFFNRLIQLVESQSQISMKQSQPSKLYRSNSQETLFTNENLRNINYTPQTTNNARSRILLAKNKPPLESFLIAAKFKSVPTSDESSLITKIFKNEPKQIIIPKRDTKIETCSMMPRFQGSFWRISPKKQESSTPL